MKRLNVMLATVLACGAVEITAQRAALPPANLPPPFPRAGAKQLLENDRVRVWDYTFTPHRVGPLHRHVRDAVAVWLEGGKLKATSRDGTSNVNTQRRFTATYSRRGGVHTEEAIEGAPHAYVFELR